MNETEQRNPVEVLCEEFLEQLRRGETKSIDQYVAAHREHADEIRRLFPAMLAMEQLKTNSVEFEPVESLGDFRILGEIGRGGMGIVYEAEQLSLNRTVAVKVLPRQALRDSRQLKRFQQEARTAAGLHHTNIVTVFGVGEHEGLHFFVMQRIHGTALDELIRQHIESADGKNDDGKKVGPAPPGRQASALDPDDILATSQSQTGGTEWHKAARIGVQVAEALAYAHAQGVLHCDIKPSNLLLDQKGTVWVTDFGLAKVLDTGRLSNPGDVVGTLRFMSPEHLEGKPTAQSDIYSLGVTLYELLTLRPAFDEDDYTKLIRQICDGVVSPAREVRPDIPRDLSAVIDKAISVNPRHRYRDAAALANDLRRFLDGQPVAARPIGFAERALRWIDRNRAVASLSAMLLAVVVLSFVLISGKWREAVVEHSRAEDNLSLALDSMDQLLEQFTSSWMTEPAPTHVDGTPVGIQHQLAVSDHSAAVLEDALQFYDRFAEQNATNPKVERATARVHRRVADIYARLGQFGKAEEAYLRAIEILNNGFDPRDSSLCVEKASALNQLGVTFLATSRFSQAAQWFEKADLVLNQSAHVEEPACQVELARTYKNLGQSSWLTGRPGDAREHHRKAVSILETIVQNNPDQTEYRLALAQAYRTYYPFVVFGGERQDAERIRSAGVKILEELVSDFPDVPDYQCELSEMLATTSLRTPAGTSDARTQVDQLERAAELARNLVRLYGTIPRYRAVLARVLKDQAQVTQAIDRHKSEQLYEEAVGIYKTLAREFSTVPAFHLFLAMALRDQTENLRELGDAVEARQAIEEGISKLNHYGRLRPDSRFAEWMLADFFDEHARVLIANNAVDEAAKATQQAQAIRRRLSEDPT